jgi:thiamine biosynthesis lipoprotein
MGVQVRIVAYGPDQASADAAAKAAFDRVGDLEECMSDYLNDSELMRLCRRSGQRPVQVSDDLFHVLDSSRQLSQISDGAFDVTVGPLVQLWRAARKSGTLPTDAALAEARSRIGWQKMKLDPQARTVELTVPGMRLDLGGIAKGYACDEAIRVLREHGIGSALVEAGGDIVVSNPPPGRRGWAIDVTPQSSAAQRTVTLRNQAISTSGAAAQFVEIGGVRYSHVVDPHTGLGLTNHYEATVTAPRGITSDALSTTATILGPRRTQRLVKRFGARAWVRKVEPVTTRRHASTTSGTNP